LTDANISSAILEYRRWYRWATSRGEMG